MGSFRSSPTKRTLERLRQNHRGIVVSWRCSDLQRRTRGWRCKLPVLPAPSANRASTEPKRVVSRKRLEREREKTKRSMARLYRSPSIVAKSRSIRGEVKDIFWHVIE